MSLRPVRVCTGSADVDGQLVFVQNFLVAVLVRLADGQHGGLIGAWHVEAAFGPCAFAGAPIFDTLEDAQAWVAGQIDRDAERRA